MNQENHSSKSPIIAGILAIAVIVILVGAVIALGGKDDAATDSTPASNATVRTEPATGTYKSGTYDANGTYRSPGGTEEIAVTITLNGNTITDASVTPKAASSTSKEYQAEFVAGYKKMVVGKDINEVKLSNVSGSSLTSRGFNEALDEIRSEARI